MTEPISIYLPWPDRCLSPNSRAHWAKVAAAKKSMRGVAKILLREAMGRRCAPRWREAWVAIDAFPPNRRRRDKDNLKASLKAAFDGAQDAGVLEDDSGLDFQPTKINDPEPGNPGVWLTFYPKIEDTAPS